MTVRKVGLDHWYSTLADETYDSELAARHYDDLERLRSSPESEGQKILDSLSTAQLKSLIIEMNVQSDQPAGRMDWQQIQQEFVDTHPDFFACPTNGGALSAVLVERGKLTPHGEFTGTMADIEEAYCDLAERNVLLRREGTPLPKRPFNEAAAYELPFDELEKRARGW
jgi:hypothetical protein